MRARIKSHGTRWETATLTTAPGKPSGRNQPRVKITVTDRAGNRTVIELQRGAAFHLADALVDHFEQPPTPTAQGAPG